MKRILFIVLLFFIGCNNDNDRLKVGAAIALTGFGADFGESERNAITLLQEKYGDVEFYIEDTSSDVNTGINAIKKLMNIHKVDIIYCELSSIVHATNSIIGDYKIRLLAPVYLDDLLNNPFALRNLPSADQENSVLLQYLDEQNIDFENVAVLYSNDVFGLTCKSSFENLVANKNVCFSSYIDDNSLNALSLKTIAKNPEVIYLGSMSESLGILVKYLRQNGYMGEIITTDAFGYNYINSLAGDYARGVIYVDFKKSDTYCKFKEHYKTVFGKECVPSAMLCYDGLSIVIEAMKKGENIEGYAKEGLVDSIYIKNQEIIYPIEALRW